MKTISQEILETIEIFRRKGERSVDPCTGTEVSTVVFFDPVLICAFKVWIPDMDFMQPAVRFEKSHGVSGLSQSYILPPGISPAELQTYVDLTHWRRDISFDERNQRMQRLWRQVLTDNSVLSSIKCEKTLINLVDLLVGVASGFNTVDIQYYLDERNLSRQDETREPAFRKMENGKNFADLSVVFKLYAAKYKLELHKPDINWVAAPETLSSIQKQLAAKLKDNPRAK